MNSVDFKVLVELMNNGRITWAELASRLGLSSPATAERVRRLEEQGVIKGFTALIEPEAVGCSLTAFVAITLEHPKHRNSFLMKVSEMDEIQECHHIAGDDDYFLKIRCRGTRDLEHIISNQIKSIPGVTRTRTTIVLNTYKETPRLPAFLNSRDDVQNQR
jgi:Lrp/AsnC family transcriptional regulator, leucine-responsive regulatory protein